MNDGIARYKFLDLTDGRVVSRSGEQVWHKNEWVKVPGKLAMCGRGLHCSLRMFDAFAYVSGAIVARVEVVGEHESQNDKEAWQQMRLVDIRRWRKEDSVALSIYSAELCLANYEEIYPGDDRPRKAIEAAAEWLAKPTEANRMKAEAAESAAWSAARSAAESAARSAAWSARSAAESAAWSAALEEVKVKISKWMEARFDELPVYEETE
jgi:hypothetical protein